MNYIDSVAASVHRPPLYRPAIFIDPDTLLDPPAQCPGRFLRRLLSMAGLTHSSQVRAVIRSALSQRLDVITYRAGPWPRERAMLNAPATEWLLSQNLCPLLTPGTPPVAEGRSTLPNH